MRVHLVYPQRAGSIIAPWTIGNHLLDALVSAGHAVSWSDWDDVRAPERCDLLIGHPHPEPGCAYEIAAHGADRKIAICPVNFEARGSALVRDWRARGLWDHLLAICGPEWESELDPAWPCTRLDMAVDCDIWDPLPAVDRNNNRVLYVGCTLPLKGTDRLRWLSEVAGDRLDICHIGPGIVGGRVRSLGIAPGGSWRRIAHMFPRIISMGLWDANPTCLIEGAALGLTPFATKGSGWGEDLVVRLPEDLEACVDVLLSDPLEPRIDVAQRYNWERFVSTVLGAVDMC